MTTIEVTAVGTLVTLLAFVIVNVVHAINVGVWKGRTDQRLDTIEKSHEKLSTVAGGAPERVEHLEGRVDRLEQKIDNRLDTIQDAISAMTGKIADLVTAVAVMDKTKVSTDKMQAIDPFGREARDPTPAHGVPVWRPDPRRER